MHNIIIDPEFKSLIPPLSSDEREALEASIKDEGCRDALVVWQGEDILVDGHNRYEICTKHNVEYNVLQKEFADREAVANWMIDNQLGRRNLHPDKASYLRGKKYNRVKQQGKRTDLTSPQNEERLSTSQAIAKDVGVGRATIERDGKYADAIDAIAKTVSEDTRDAILNHEVKSTRKDIQELAKMAQEQPDDAKQVVSMAKAAQADDIGHALDLHKYLKDAPQRFKDFVLRMRFKDTWRIEVTRSWFDSNNGDYSKFECVEKSGVLDWGDDDDGIDIRTCTLSELRIGEAQWKRAKRTINMEAAQKEREDRANELAKLAVLPNNIEVIHGDMLEVLATTDKRYDLVVADPPYNVTPYAWDVIGSDDVYLARVREWLIAIKGVLKPEYTMYWFCAAEYAARTELLLQELAYPIQSRIIWHRRNKAMGGKATRKYLSTWEMAYHVGNRDMNFPDEWDASWFDVQTHAVPQSNFNDENEKRHPTQKPFELIQNFVRFGSFPGDLVLDPFAGNGTTGRACYVEGNRQCTMIEQDKEYIDVIHSRYAA